MHPAPWASRLAIYPPSSGHTPRTLSPLCDTLLFEVQPSTLNFHHARVHPLCATTTVSHLVSAFIWLAGYGDKYGESHLFKVQGDPSM